MSEDIRLDYDMSRTPWYAGSQVAPSAPEHAYRRRIMLGLVLPISMSRDDGLLLLSSD